MRGGVAQGGDLVVVAGDAVQRLGDVRCPLQDDLLGRRGSVRSAPSSRGPPAPRAPAAPTKAR